MAVPHLLNRPAVRQKLASFGTLDSERGGPLSADTCSSVGPPKKWRLKGGCLGRLLHRVQDSRGRKRFITRRICQELTYKQNVILTCFLSIRVVITCPFISRNRAAHGPPLLCDRPGPDSGALCKCIARHLSLTAPNTYLERYQSTQNFSCVSPYLYPFLGPRFSWLW